MYSFICPNLNPCGQNLLSPIPVSVPEEGKRTRLPTGKLFGVSNPGAESLVLLKGKLAVEDCPQIPTLLTSEQVNNFAFSAAASAGSAFN